MTKPQMADQIADGAVSWIGQALRISSFLIVLSIIIGGAGFAAGRIDAATASSIISNPIFGALIAAVFIYLTLDRVKDISDRVTMVQSDTSTAIAKALESQAQIYSDLSKDVTRRVDEQLRGEILKLSEAPAQSLREALNSVEEFKSANPWVALVDDSQILETTNLEPVHARISELIEAGQKTIAYRWAEAIASSPNLKGSPVDFFNMAVTTDRDLSDTVLASIFFQRAVDHFGYSANADNVAQYLKVCTTLRDLKKAEELFAQLSACLDLREPDYLRAWRVFVFASDYLYFIGKESDAIEILNRGLKTVESKGVPHLRRNIASILVEVGKHDEAERILKDVVAEFPNHLPAYVQLKRLVDSRGMIDEGDRLAKKGILLAACEPEYSAVLSQLLRELQMREKISEMLRDGDDPEFGDAVN